jgi:hypothetical protein
MKISKSAALIIAVIILFVMFILLYLKAADITDIPTGAFITGIVTLIAGYIGLGVANNGVKGKYWNNDMYDRENGGDHLTPQKGEIDGNAN